MNIAFLIRLLRALSIVAIILGALFKIQHYSYGGILLTSGCIALVLVYLAEFIAGEMGRARRR